MSEVRFVLREQDRDWSGTIHGSCADRAIAALSADPFTREELELATTRFSKPVPGSPFFMNLRPGLHDEPYDAGLVIVDLVARLVVVDSTYSSPGREGYVDFHNGECCTDQAVRYHMADDWLFSTDSNEWRALAEKRRRERLAKPDRDDRAVFYGRPLLEFIAHGVYQAFARRDEITAAARAQWLERARERLAKAGNTAPEQVDTGSLTDEEITERSGEDLRSPFYDAIKQIHADWLLTPRDDLGGACPREIALARRGHLDWDMQDRCEQWSFLGECPRGLEATSHAYRYAGFGTHELVVYYYLVRELIWSCWDQLIEQAAGAHGPSALTLGDFLTTEVPRLEKVREASLDTPDREYHMRTPRSIIARERARLPEGVSGREAMADPDCPCCQMMADMPGPSFWHLDGCNMDNEFAFDISHSTRDEWEAEQREWEEHFRRSNAKWAERERLEITDYSPRADSVWSRSLTIGETADVPLGVRLFGVGCHLAELIVDLRLDCEPGSIPQQAQAYIDQLNRDFGNFRELLQSADASLAETLIEPVLERFVDTLASVGASRPDLAQKCESLTTDLGKMLDPPSLESTSNEDDDELPF